jgi:hypothetical protein
MKLVDPDAVHLITLKPTIFSGFASLVSRYFHGQSPRRGCSGFRRGASNENETPICSHQA